MHSCGCENLKSINIPNGVTSIGESAFSGCSNLQEVNLPEGLKKIDKGAFSNCGFETIVIPSTIERIDSYAFRGCKNLKSIPTVDYGNIYLGDMMFQNCTSLEEVIIPDGMTSISYYSFAGCTGLKKVTIPNHVKTLGTNVFKDCTSLNTVEMKGYNTSISDTAFSGCDNVTIYGYTGSKAETYATEKEIPFISIGETAEYTIEHYIEEGDTGTYKLGTTTTSREGIGEEVKALSAGYNYYTLDNTIEGTIESGTVLEDGSLVLKLYYTRNKYNIAYELNGGINNNENPIKHLAGEYTELKEPTRLGYDFIGWYDNENFEGLAITRIPSNRTEDITLYAKWELTEYAIQYNLDGGELEEGEINPTKYTIETETFTLNNPTKVGYIFKGWTGTNLEEATQTVIIEKGSIGELEYTATWEAIVYSISYNLDGGELEKGEINPTKYTIETENITLNNPSKDGYVFKGWTGTNLEEITQTVTIEKGSIGNLEYTATWEAIEYSITYNLDGGNLAEGETNPTKYTIETENFILNNPSKEGYVFKGWTGTNLEEATETVTIEKGNTGDLEYKATWEVVEYSITYNLDDGELAEGETNPTKYTIETENITLNNPSKEGYVFKGWTGTNLEKATEIVTIEKGSVGNLEYKATWEAVGYPITYVLNGGINNPENKDTYLYGIGLELKDPTRVGCEFKGWYENSDFEGEKITRISEARTGNITLYAKWEAVPGIDVKLQPTKLTYIKGEELDLTGGVILLTNQDTTTEDISMTAEGVVAEGYKADILGEQTITVTYAGYTTTFTVTVTNDVTGIEIKTKPSKLTYIKGEELDLSCGEITATYQDKTTKDFVITTEMISGYDKTKVGAQTVTVTYEGKTTTFDITVTNDVTGIEIKTAPKKLTYIKGEELDLTDVKITAIYQDTTTKDFVITAEMISGYDKTKVGTQTVTVTYEGKTATFDVTVTNDVTGITLKTAPKKLTYIKGEELDLTDGVITAIYQDKTTKDFAITTEMISGYDKTKVGAQTVTVTYESKTTKFDVTVTNDMTGIEIKTAPKKLIYIKGEDLDLTNGVITATYQDKTTKDFVITAEMISGYDKTKVEEQTITVTYEGFTTTYKIEVTNDVVGYKWYVDGKEAIIANGIEIKEGKKAEIELYEVLQNGEKNCITGSASIGSYDNEIAWYNDDSASIEGIKKGETILGADYGLTGSEVFTELPIKVIGIKEIAVRTAPSKTVYIKGEELSLSSGVVKVIYEDETTEDINMTDTKIEVTGYKGQELGSQTITVTYREHTATFTVNVTNDITGIVVKTKPDKLTYIKGEELDLSCGVITATYQDKTTKDIAITAEMISGYAKTKVGTQTVTVTYEGKTTAFDVTVTNDVTEISLKVAPKKLTYIKGEELDLNDGVITATYEDTTTKDFAITADMISGYDKTQVGAQTVTVTYEGKTATFDVTVTNDVVGLGISKLPTKTTYIKGESLDLSGGLIEVQYQDGSYIDISMTNNEVKVTGYDKNTLEEQTITLEYKGKEVSFTVNVTNNITGVSIEVLPIKTTYLKGEELDLTGGVIKVTYQDKTTEEILMTSEGVNQPGIYDKTKLGEQTIILEYKGYRVEFKINVIEKVLETDEYTITVENETTFIENIDGNTTMGELKNNISTEGSIEIYKGEEKIEAENTKLTTGMELRVTLNNKTTAYNIVVNGDISGDGEIDQVDLLMLARYKAGFDKEKEVVKGAYLRATDIVKDNNVATDADLLKLARVLAHLDEL